MGSRVSVLPTVTPTPLIYQNQLQVLFFKNTNDFFILMSISLTKAFHCGPVNHHANFKVINVTAV